MMLHSASPDSSFLLLCGTNLRPRSVAQHLLRHRRQGNAGPQALRQAAKSPELPSPLVPPEGGEQSSQPRWWGWRSALSKAQGVAVIVWCDGWPWGVSAMTGCTELFGGKGPYTNTDLHLPRSLGVFFPGALKGWSSQA